MPEIFNLDCKGKLSLKSTIQMKIFLIGIHQTVDPLLSFFFISDQLSPTSDLISNERYQNKKYQTLVISKAAGEGGEKKLEEV